MKKLLVLTLSAVLVLSFLVVSPAAATTYWTGDPDPMACNVYHDCHWVTPVCIGGNTFDVGIWYDPVGATDEQIEASALSYGTVLTAGACAVPFHGYSVPHVILYKGSELINGYGIIVSTKSFAAVDYVLAAFKLPAPLPDDVKPICEGAVTQMNANDVQGTWVCDYLLVDILPYGRPGGRLPLINADGNSLQKVYEKILSWIK